VRKQAPDEDMEFALMTDKLRLSESSTQDGTREAARLISRAQAGDLRAFDQIMIDHQRRIMSLAWRLLGNQEDARDAAQETFLRVYKHLNKFNPSQEFSAWLYRIAVNVCRDFARKRNRNLHVSFEAEIESGNMSEPVSSLNTEASAMRAQEQLMVLKALATLSGKERAAIVLRDLEGLPTEEVANILGSSPTTVRSQICSARIKIKTFRDRCLTGKRGPK
jgi:RNA polymerase sigma-70 factor (ECF subfamily)